MHAKGMCSRCYQRARLEASAPCPCGSGKVHRKGMCSACYARTRRADPKHREKARAASKAWRERSLEETIGRVKHLQSLPNMPAEALDLLGDLEARLLYGVKGWREKNRADR